MLLLYSPLNSYLYVHWILDFKYILLLLYILWMYNGHFVHVHKICLHNVHVFMYKFAIMVMKVHFGPRACIQLIRVIYVTRIRNDLEYSDTNEIWKYYKLVQWLCVLKHYLLTLTLTHKIKELENGGTQ